MDTIEESTEIRTLTVEGHSTSTAHRLLHYDGACNNVHGHNMVWNVELKVTVPDDEHNMALDFKDVSGLLDDYDHAIILNEDDPLVNAPDGVVDLLGDVILTEGDPTCERVGQDVAERFVDEFDNVLYAEVTMYETDKYGMAAYHY